MACCFLRTVGVLKDDPGFKLNELPFVIGQSFNKSNAENCVVK